MWCSQGLNGTNCDRKFNTWPHAATNRSDQAQTVAAERGWRRLDAVCGRARAHSARVGADARVRCEAPAPVQLFCEKRIHNGLRLPNRRKSTIGQIWLLAILNAVFRELLHGQHCVWAPNLPGKDRNT